MALDNNGKSVERAIAIVMFIIQIGAIALSYGSLKQQVADIQDRVVRIERWMDDHDRRTFGENRGR